MRVGLGLYYDFSFPGAGERFWGELREQAVAADELGYDSVWYGERHFADYVPGAVHVLAANAAAATRAIRIGGFPVRPLANPVRVAGDWAVVDLVAGGRVNVGLSLGDDRDAFRAYDRDWKRREQAFWEIVDFVRHAWRATNSSTSAATSASRRACRAGRAAGTGGCSMRRRSAPSTGRGQVLDRENSPFKT